MILLYATTPSSPPSQFLLPLPYREDGGKGKEGRVKEKQKSKISSPFHLPNFKKRTTTGEMKKNEKKRTDIEEEKERKGRKEDKKETKKKKKLNLFFFSFFFSS